MKRNHLIQFSLVLLLVTGCSPFSINPRPTVVISVPVSQTITSTVLSTTSTPIISTQNPTEPIKAQTNIIPSPPPSLGTTASEELLPLPTSIHGSGIVRKCIDLQNTIEGNNGLMGWLTLDSSPLTFLKTPEATELNLNTGEKMVLNDGRVPDNIRISPNREHYFYLGKQNNIGQRVLSINSPNGKEEVVIPWNNSWGEDNYWQKNRIYWLNDQQIAIFPPVSSEYKYGSVIVLNPFTGKWKSLQQAYPGGLNIDQLVIRYNSSQDHAIYRSGDKYILWAMNSNKVIWEGKFASNLFMPQWSSDGSKVLLGLFNDLSISSDIGENNLYLLDTQGKDNKLTHLRDWYKVGGRLYTTSPAWSPDENKIAFLFGVNNENKTYEEPVLLILDLQAKVIYDTCILPSTNQLIWSPDGTKLAITVPVNIRDYIYSRNSTVSQDGNVIVIDLEKWTGIIVAQHTAVIGWMGDNK